MPKLAVRDDIGLEPPAAPPQQEDPEYRKISMNVQLTDLVELKRWAAEEETTVSELIRRALVLLRFLANEQMRGATIVIKAPPRGGKDKVLKPLRHVGLTLDLS
jgi:hypothetical protein